MARMLPTGLMLVAAAAASLATLVACGDSTDTANTASTPSTSGAAAQSADAPASTNTSATALPGPRLPSATSVPPSRESPSIAGARCGTAPGPEGSLRVVVLAGGADCAAVTPIAQAYGPKISLGREQQVAGWTCGPSQTTGVLARCVRGEDAFGFVPQ